MCPHLLHHLKTLWKTKKNDFLKVYNELGKIKKIGPQDPFFHGEIAVWKKCRLNLPPPHRTFRVNDKLNFVHKHYKSFLQDLFRCREDEVKAEMAEREVQKLQKEVDKLEVKTSFFFEIIFISTFSFWSKMLQC